jgi:hypothetical protein
LANAVPVLDLRTIERLAEMICDQDGPHARSVRALTRFLEGAGWDVAYEGGARVPWLVEEIRERNDDPEAIHALLKRIIDPREYDGGIGEASAFVDALNDLLAADGLEVGHQSGTRPVVRQLENTGELGLDQLAARLADPKLRQAVREMVSDSAMAEILVARLDEVDACRRAGAYLLAVIGTGSFVEGLLYDVLKSRDQSTQKNPKPMLDFLLGRAHKLGWIQHDAYTFSGLVREYRNLVHPREQLDKSFHPDSDTVLLCWQPVLAVINDLQAHLPSIGPQRRGAPAPPRLGINTSP